MICDEIRDDLELYALGLLDAEEHGRVASHLASECATCRAALTRALAMNALVEDGVPEAAPPVRLRGKVLGALTGRPQRSWWRSGWLAVVAGLTGVAILLGAGLQREQRALAEAREHSEAMAAWRVEMEQALSVLSDPRTRIAVAGAEARGSYYVTPGRGVLFIGASLSAPEGGRAYQMWILPKQGAPQPAGVFQPSVGGTAVHLFTTAVDTSAVAALALTVEPESGSAAPTTTPMLVAKFGG